MIRELNGDFLQWLRGFYYVATLGSVSKAAALMHRNQSSITYQIRSLERALGNALFSRVNKQMILTAAGEALLNRCIAMFDLLDAMCDDLACMDGCLRGIIQISGTRPTFQAEIFREALKEYTDAHPNVRVQLLPGEPEQIICDIKMGKNDFSLIGVQKPPSLCLFNPLFESSHVLVASKNRTFKLSTIPTRAQLEEIPLIMPIHQKGGVPSLRFISDDVMYLFKNFSNIYCSNLQVAMEYAANGFGCVIIDLFSLLSFYQYRDKIDVFCLDNYLPRLHYGILSRHTREMTRPAKIFLEMLRNRLSHLDLSLSLFYHEIH